MNLFELFGIVAITGADKANEDIDKTTENASSLGENLKKGITTAAKWGVAIGTAAAGVTTAFVKMAQSSASTTDNIDKMSQKIGISREAYQELDFICSQSGTSVDTLQMGIKSLTSAMDGAASGTASNVEQFEKLGISVTDSSGNLRSQEDVMWETMAALQSLDNQTEKARLATELFGRSGTELMPLLNGASGSIEEMKNQAHELGLVLDDETIDSGVELTDTMDQMKRSLSSLVTKLSGSLMPIVTKLCRFIINNIPKIEKIFNEMAPVLTQVFDELMPILMELIDEILPILLDLVSDLLPVFSQIAKSILPIFVKLIETIMPPLAEIIDTVLPVLTGLLEVLLPVVSGLLEVLKPILDVVIAILQPVLDLAGQGISALAEAFGFATEKVDAAVQAARDEAQAMEDVMIAAENARQAVDDKAASELASLSTTESLWSELQTLADEQGNVAEKDKARAEFLTGQLAEALGIEIEWTGNQIQNYKDLQTEIDNTIEKKKAEILLAASEENYAAAIKNRSEAEQNLTTATQNRAAAMDELQRLQEQGYTIDDELYKNALDRASSAQEAYADAKLTVKGYYDDIAEYETAQSLMLQGQTDEAIDLLSQQGQAFQTASELASESAEEQQRILEGQLEDAALKMQVQYDLLSGLSDDCSESQRKTYEDAFKQSQEYFANSVTEYEKSGGTIGESFFNSISEKMGKDRFKTIGSYIVDGIAQGASGSKYSLINTMNSLIDDVINAPRQRASGGTSGGGRAGGGTSGTPHMAKGGVLKKGQVGFLEGDGDEAVVPLSQNTEWIDRVADKLNSKGNNDDIARKLDDVVEAIRALKLYINGSTLVGAIADDMNSALGQVQIATERGM